MWSRCIYCLRQRLYIVANRVERYPEAAEILRYVQCYSRKKRHVYSNSDMWVCRWLKTCVTAEKKGKHKNLIIHPKQLFYMSTDGAQNPLLYHPLRGIKQNNFPIRHKHSFADQTEVRRPFREPVFWIEFRGIIAQPGRDEHTSNCRAFIPSNLILYPPPGFLESTSMKTKRLADSG